MNPQPRLIVNADDFGLSPGVNAGIAAAHRDGILTSATLLVNAPHCDEAIALSRSLPGLGVGLHLNLVRGRPLSPAGEVPLLIDGGGRLRLFRFRRMTREFLLQAEREYRRQFEKMLAAGVSPTHIDFEKHHAWQPALYRLACRLAGEYGVRAVRNLREPLAWTVRRVGWPGFAAALRAGALRTGVQSGRSGFGGLAHPDRLLGQAHIGGMTEAVWLRLLAGLPGGVSEVMTHPGGVESEGVAMGSSWLAAKRRAELDALLSSRVRAAVGGIRLMHFGEFGA